MLAADLTDTDGLAGAASRLQEASRPVDLLVNCAGIGAAGPFAEGELERYRAVIDLNVTALVPLTHAAVVPMARHRRGW